MSNTYLDWVIENTPTKWWHDSAEAGELDLGLERGRGRRHDESVSVESRGAGESRIVGAGDR